MPGEGEGARRAEDCSGLAEGKDEELVNGLVYDVPRIIKQMLI